MQGEVFINGSIRVPAVDILAENDRHQHDLLFAVERADMPHKMLFLHHSRRCLLPAREVSGPAAFCHPKVTCNMLSLTS